MTTHEARGLARHGDVRAQVGTLARFWARLRSPIGRTATGGATLLLAAGLLLGDGPAWCWGVAWALHWWGGVATLGYVGHLQAHRRLCASRAANRALEATLALLTGMTVDSWRVTHVLGHHRAHWPAMGRSSVHVYTGLGEDHAALRRYGLGRGLAYAAATLWSQWFGYLGFAARRTWAGGLRAVFYRRVLRQAALYLAAMGLLSLWQPLWALVFLWIPHLLTHFFSRYVDYLFHAGALPRSDYLFCFTCLDPAYNRAAFNTGFHVAHHYWPRMPWQALPGAYQRLREARPELVLGERGTPFGGGRWAAQFWRETGREDAWMSQVNSG